MPRTIIEPFRIKSVEPIRWTTRTEREQLPLFFADERCVWLGGVCIDDQYRLTTGTHEIVHVSINPSSVET